ncbi:GNAT family N-acetyltransferase [Anaerocolumna sp. AGMB13025]|uniref:GNAT family N-acetyltransferase n=1 Tax=Anaerocolumna sp. AGMB13025 TaxID=3039116 RepID=UPI00241D9F25|nr:GNAT family N-acetyltransferase [Anaerocolumna sp. AGMB13025]WFR59577.1 GNAT family N-acetyltransferase [Anaerocolumna sp. AGMB13025]
MNDIIYYENTVTAEELCLLQAAVGFGQANIEQADKAIKNSLFCVSAMVNGKIAGMGRIIGDGARIFYLQDVFIAPDYQRMGIGTEIVTRMMKFIKNNSFEHAHTAVGLMAAKGKEDFYMKLGFRVRPNDHEGHGMIYTMNP